MDGRMGWLSIMWRQSDANVRNLFYYYHLSSFIFSGSFANDADASFWDSLTFKSFFTLSLSLWILQEKKKQSLRENKQKSVINLCRVVGEKIFLLLNYHCTRNMIAHARYSKYFFLLRDPMKARMLYTTVFSCFALLFWYNFLRELLNEYWSEMDFWKDKWSFSLCILHFFRLDKLMIS
jgi:hypothetical protein